MELHCGRSLTACVRAGVGTGTQGEFLKHWKSESFKFPYFSGWQVLIYPGQNLLSLCALFITVMHALHSDSSF